MGTSRPARHTGPQGRGNLRTGSPRPCVLMSRNALTGFDQAVQVLAEIGVVLVPLEQIRPWSCGADQDRLPGMPPGAPVEAGLPGYHPPQQILQRIGVIAFERLLL